LVQSATVSAPPLRAGWARSRWIFVGGGLVALGVGIAAGYGWGYHAGLAARPAETPDVPAARAPAVVGPVTLPAPPASAASKVVTDAPEPPPLSPLAAPTHVSRATPSMAPLAPSAEASGTRGLDEEVRQLRRIERAIRDGNPRLALAIADNLDRDIAHGQLLTERRAARLMAGCQLDVAAGASAAQLFLATNPQTAYASRIRELCGVTSDPQRNDGAPGTHQGIGRGEP
jgi:hypothetical protein